MIGPKIRLITLAHEGIKYLPTSKIRAIMLNVPRIATADCFVMK